MGLVTWSDNKPTQTLNFGFDKWPCGTVNRRYSFNWTPGYKSVTSYRGKPTYVQVGSKRRRRFNEFNRFRLDFDPPVQTVYACPNVSGCKNRNCWGENMMLANWWYKTPIYPLTYHPYLYGDMCPFTKEGSLYNFGDELREFVVRDLYIKANAPDFEGAVFLAELEETVTELHNIFKSAVKGLTKTSTGLKTLRHVALHPEELWLWFRYFLMPAMMDAEDIARAVKGTARIDRVQDGDRSDGFQEMSGTSYYTGTLCTTYACEWRSKYKYGLGGAIDIYSRNDPSHWGFQNWDVLRATWERIPWSFVADWFVNFGDWLASLRDANVSYAQSYASFAIEAETTVSFPEWHADKDEVVIRSFLQNRIIDLEPPSLPLIDRRWRNLNRTIDLISLLTAIIRRSTTRRK